MTVRTVALTVLAAATLAGCGGRELFNNNIPNIYAGEWSGQWVDVLRPATGILDWEISNTGLMTGSITRDSDGEEGLFSGTVSRDGRFTGAAAFDDAADFSEIRGTITRDSNGPFGTFSYLLNGQRWTATFDFRVPPTEEPL